MTNLFTLHKKNHISHWLQLIQIFMKYSLLIAFIALQFLALIQCEIQLSNTQSLQYQPSGSTGTSPNISFLDIFSNNKCKLPDKPLKLAITCITRLRARTEEDIPEAVNFFKVFLNRYAQMNCDAFDNIYFIWNNQKPPHQYEGLLDRKKYWKKNVFFLQTVNNSLDHRWALPPWAPEQGFFSLDDDAQIDCQNIQNGFSGWKEHFVAGIGPLASPFSSARLYKYNGQSDQFTYSTQTKSYFSLAIPNVGIVDRHFADLYYASFPEFEKMRETVSEMINCDDISLNFMIGYVYPEISPIVLEKVSVLLKSSKVELNKSPKHYSNRTEAVNRFSKILGENTLRYTIVHRNQSLEKSNTKPLVNHECLIAMKRSVIQQKYFSYNHYYNFMKGVTYENSSEIESQLLQKIRHDQYIFSIPKDVRLEMNRTGKIDLSYKPKYNFDQGLKNEGHILRPQYRSSEDLKELKNQNKLLKLILIVTFSLLLIVVFILAFRYFMIKKGNSKKEYIREYEISKSEESELQYGTNTNKN